MLKVQVSNQRASKCLITTLIPGQRLTEFKIKNILDETYLSVVSWFYKRLARQHQGTCHCPNIWPQQLTQRYPLGPWEPLIQHVLYLVPHQPKMHVNKRLYSEQLMFTLCGEYCIYLKHSDRHSWTNSVDPDQTAPSGAVWSDLHCLPSSHNNLETS